MLCLTNTLPSDTLLHLEVSYAWTHPILGVAVAAQTAMYCGSGLNMMLLLFIHCLWEYLDPSGSIFSLAFVHGRVGVSGYCGDLSRTTRRRSVLGAMLWMRKDVFLHDRAITVTVTTTVTVTLVWAYAHDHLIEFQFRRVVVISCKSVYTYMYSCYDHDFNRVIRWHTAMFALACAALVHVSLL